MIFFMPILTISVPIILMFNVFVLKQNPQSNHNPYYLFIKGGLVVPFLKCACYFVCYLRSL